MTRLNAQYDEFDLYPNGPLLFSPIKIGENLADTSNRYLFGSWHSPWPGQPDLPLRVVIDRSEKKIPVIQERLRGRWRPVDAKDHAYIEAVILEQFEHACGDADVDGLTPTDELPQWADEAPSFRQKEAVSEVQQAMETAGWMRHAYDTVTAQQVERFGDTVAVRRKAATLAFAVFRHAGYSQATARAYPEALSAISKDPGYQVFLYLSSESSALVPLLLVVWAITFVAIVQLALQLSGHGELGDGMGPGRKLVRHHALPMIVAGGTFYIGQLSGNSWGSSVRRPIRTGLLVHGDNHGLRLSRPIRNER